MLTPPFMALTLLPLLVSFLLDAARRAGVPDEVHEAAYLHAKAYEARRDAGRLPGS